MKVGRYLLGLGSMATGILNVVWRDFDPSQQPVGALSDHIPARAVLACIAGVWLMVAGGAVLFRGAAARWGAVALGVFYLFWSLCWAPRFVSATRVLGLRIPVIFGLLVGVFEPLILVAAAAAIYARMTDRAMSARWPRVVTRSIFGMGSIVFGVNHLLSMQGVTDMIPKWMPLPANLWAVLTGIAFILAGVAILCGVMDVLAARLLGVMLLVFSALALAPILIAHPRAHGPWGSNAFNLAAIGAAWVYAEFVEARDERGSVAEQHGMRSAPLR